MNGSDKAPRAWQRMLSGRRLDILDPSPLDIEISDIALGLSRVARWNGQTTGQHGFSVAQHCVLVTECLAGLFPSLPRKARLAALLHDAPEYVTSDLITPFKRAIGAVYCDIEDRMAQAVHLAFGLPADLPAHWQDAIKQCDRILAWQEAVAVAGFSPAEASQIIPIPAPYRQPVPLSAWAADQAKDAFLTCFHSLQPRTETG